MITGCLGTIGIKTINYLLANTDYKIIGVDNCISNPYERINEINNTDNRFEYFNEIWDSRNSATLPLFDFYKIDCILHLAGLIGSMNNSTSRNVYYFIHNEEFTVTLLNYCVEYKIPKFIFASSSSVYGNQNKKLVETDKLDPIAMYGITKANSERYINYYNKYFGINTVILRYANVVADIKYYGYKGFVPLMVDKMMNNEEIGLYNCGQSKRQYIFIDNIVEANMLAIENNMISGETFNITVDEEPIKLLEVCDYIYNKLGKRINYTIFPEKEFGDIDSIYMDNSKAKEKLGFKIITNMYEGIDKYINYVRG